MTTTVPAELPISEARAILTDIATAAKEHHATTTLTKHGKPIAKLVHPDADEGELDALKAAVEQLTAELEDQRAAKQTASDAADRFRDVLSEALGHPDENPGDDVLVAELRTHFGKTGPEPIRWREFLTGARAIVDQINAAALAAPEIPAPTTRTETT